MKRLPALFLATLGLVSLHARAASFDAAPFSLPLPEGQGVLWEDPREVHRVIAHFAGAAPPAETVTLQYWGSRWPEQRLPKAREPGGGDVGWMELGNWYQGGWRTADALVQEDGSTLRFSFRPVNGKEFPQLKNYAADFRYTLKLRLLAPHALPRLERLEAFTDSTVTERVVRLAWRTGPSPGLSFEAFNGAVQDVEGAGLNTLIHLVATTNSDPNTFDRTLLTVRNGPDVFTIRVDDVLNGALLLPEFGVVALDPAESGDYASIAARQQASGARTLYDAVSALPEQTWKAAWNGMPPKKSRIHFALGLDGGRQRFRLQSNGTVEFRLNDNYLEARPGKDTASLKLEPSPVSISLGKWGPPVERTLQEEVLPVCETTWVTNGLRVIQTALATELKGTRAEAPPPAGDTPTIFMARVVLSNAATMPVSAVFPLRYSAGGTAHSLQVDVKGFLWHDGRCRGQVLADHPPELVGDDLSWTWTLHPGESKTVYVKLPYLVLENNEDVESLGRLSFVREQAATAAYWRRRLDESARLLTPEPVLDQFYRAHAHHLLVNCEREPESARRFARVGSFAYGAYGNESCMMVVELDRRGYHREAQECLDAWLHYQGSVGLPGNFQSSTGVLYGAGGYEAGGYNQHHGWILWCLAEHYRFTRDRAWLLSAAPGILSAADWIVRESSRNSGRFPLERGLLPAGDLEDIGDWWPWLSTSCYTWRGLDAAAWALEQAGLPEANRIRAQADAYRAALLASFRSAAQRSPVVRLRDGTAVPHFPSQVYRRGRSFGWICETLEGALHLLITGVLDVRSPEATRILQDYEDNLYVSNQYGYTLDNFDKHWFGRGGMSMQACLLLEPEPFVRRDDVKQALRATFNAIAVSHYPDVHMNTEHALPEMGDWRGDLFKTSDEANACGWLRQLFVREDGQEMLLGQAIPREWLAPGQRCGLEKAATYFGEVTLLFTAADHQLTASLSGPTRNPPKTIRLRFRAPGEQMLKSVQVNGKTWTAFAGDWVELPGNIGLATVVVRY